MCSLFYIMDILKENIVVDGFRFIGTLHTVARQLFICSKVLQTIGNRQLPKELLTELMIKWSKEEEFKNEVYKFSKGKLTENGEKTTALKYYIDLCTSLKLVFNINNFYSCSRLSHILIHFLKKRNNENNQLAEKLFFFFQIMIVDADGILYVTQQLSHQPKTQIDLQRNFKDNFNERLIAKQAIANPIVRKEISEKYRVINFIWKKPEKYAEHLLIPRCEWLSSLGIMKIEKQGNFTQYSITEKGRLFLNQIPVISNSGIIDINEIWINRRLFFALGIIFENPDNKLFKDLNINEKEVLMGSSLENAINVIKTSNSFKFPLFDTALFVCIELFCHKNIVINISEVYELLEKGLTYQSRIYSLKLGGRINESYVLTNVLK